MRVDKSAPIEMQAAPSKTATSAPIPEKNVVVSGPVLLFRCMLLGQVYLKAKRWADAEKAFRDDLAEQPGSGWALRGLTLALMKQGKSADAAAMKAKWEKAWGDADLVMQRL